MITHENYYFSLIFLSIISMRNSCRKFSRSLHGRIKYRTGRCKNGSRELLGLENKYFLYFSLQLKTYIYFRCRKLSISIVCSNVHSSYLPHLHNSPIKGFLDFTFHSFAGNSSAIFFWSHIIAFTWLLTQH